MDDPVLRGPSIGYLRPLTRSMGWSCAVDSTVDVSEVSTLALAHAGTSEAGRQASVLDGFWMGFGWVLRCFFNYSAHLQDHLSQKLMTLVVVSPAMGSTQSTHVELCSNPHFPVTKWVVLQVVYDMRKRCDYDTVDISRRLDTMRHSFFLACNRKLSCICFPGLVGV